MEKGYDAGKKVSGIKRHIAVDTQGLPHALAVTTADVTDRKGGLLALERERDNLGAVQKVLADGGYTGKAFASSVQESIGAEVEIAKRNELHRFAVLPKRWVIERSFSWLEKNRRLWKYCEHKLSSRLGIVVREYFIHNIHSRKLPVVIAYQCRFFRRDCLAPPCRPHAPSSRVRGRRLPACRSGRCSFSNCRSSSNHFLASIVASLKECLSGYDAQKILSSTPSTEANTETCCRSSI